MPPSHGGDQGFESPTGYQKPLTLAGWFFAFMLFFQLAMKPKAQQKQGFESPTSYQKPLTLARRFFAFWMILSIASKDSNAAGNRGSNPLRAIKDHSHLLGGLLLFG